jgi:pimeloyl-ACP methyl ester carboxylesterase
VASVVTYIEEQQLEDIVLVGHSFGGTVLQKVVEELPRRIARTVFLDALILKDNQCVFDLLPDVFLESLKPKNGNHPAAVTSRETADTLATAPWETWRDNFMQDGIQEHAWLMWEQLAPEPAQVNLDRLDLKCFYSLTIPKSFIYCRQDRRCHRDIFIPGCHRVLEHAKSLRWKAATRLCLLARRNWLRSLSRQVLIKISTHAVGGNYYLAIGYLQAFITLLVLAHHATGLSPVFSRAVDHTHRGTALVGGVSRRRSAGCGLGFSTASSISPLQPR